MESLETKLLACINEKKIANLLDICEDNELEVTGTLTPAPYAIHLLAYLEVGDLDSARFLWKRVPADVKKSDPEIAAAWAIGQRIWLSDYPAVYEAIKSFHWRPAVAQLVAILEESFRRRTFELVSKAFSVISTKSLALYLGLSVADALRFAESKGWQPAGDGFFKPTPVPPAKRQIATIQNMQSLTEYVVFLESE